MAQKQVVDINALYRIGQARNYQPDNTPQFMNIVTNILGGMAVDLLHDAWDTKRTRLKTNKTQLNNVADEIAENNILTNLSAEKLTEQKKKLRKANWGSEFALRGKKRRSKKEIVNEVGAWTKNYKKNVDVFAQHKQNAQLQLNSTSDHGTHNTATVLHFNTLLGNGDLDGLMDANDENGDLFVSAEKVTGAIDALEIQQAEEHKKNGMSNEWTLIKSQKDKYKRLLTSSMDNKDYYASKWSLTQKDESAVLRNAIIDYRNDIIPGRVESSNDGIWEGNQENKSRSEVRNLLKGDPTDSTWSNKVNSYWYDVTEGDSIAHAYITQDGGFSIEGVDYEKTIDPFQFDDPEKPTEQNPDKYTYGFDKNGAPVQKEGPDGVADAMQSYIGVMEHLKTQDLNSGDYADFAEDYLTSTIKDDFEYLYNQKSKNVSEMSGHQIAAAESKARAEEVSRVIQSGVTFKSLNSLTGIKGVTPNKNGTFTIIDQDGYEVAIDPSKDTAFNRDILYRAVGVTAVSRGQATEGSDFDVNAFEKK